MYDKRELRKQCKTIRMGLKDPEKDKLIAEHALSAFGDIESCFCYLSFGSEAGTGDLIEALKERGRLVCVPKVIGRDMLSVPLSGELEAGAYGISEPKSREEHTCAVAFTPMLAVDKEGFRLGYGGGYYDRYFALHPEVLRVGLAYEGQMIETIPREDTDIPLDALVTEQGVKYFSKRRNQL